MAGSLRDLRIKISYDTFEDEPLIDFLVPALANSIRYDRAVGFFSSALLAVVAEAFTDFTERGGKMRLVCSPVFSISDVRQLESLESLNFESRLNDEIEYHAANEEVSDALSLMVWMIRKGSLDIRVAIPKSGGGLFHQKIGTFIDEKGDRVSFSGSNNETLAAWGKGINSESFTTHCEWVSDTDRNHVETIADKFERFWDDEYPGYIFLPLNRSMGFFRARELDASEDVAAIKKKIREWVENDKGSVQRLSTIRLRDYQESALQNWEKNGYKGTVSFATGAGKTITALEGISRWLNLSADHSVLILVPSVRLQKQWLNEIKCFPGLEDLHVLQAGGGHPSKDWKLGLSAFSRALSGKNARVTLATMDTAKSSPFLSRLHSSEKLLVVADEMHNLGAPSYRGLLDAIGDSAKLALTATPDRYDDEETLYLRQTFGSDLDPVIDVRKAQELGVLVKYEYQIEKVSLNEDEETEYQKLTKEISKLTAISKGKTGSSKQGSKRLSNLKIARARVIKNAAAKPGAAARLIRQNYRDGQTWIVFCSDSQQLNQLHELIQDLHPYTYFQSMDGDADATLASYRVNGGILLAIQMMDEGVDIPRIDHALLLASSQSAREFIQRRGRVLRRNPERAKLAKFWDVFVVDQDGRATSQAELVRGRIFAQDAINALVALDVEEMARDSELEKA